MTLQERLAMTQGQDNGMDIILGGIPAAAQQEQVQQLPATALRPKSNHTFKVRTGSPHYTALVDSIRSSGIRTPLLVRRDPVQPGAYEIIAGHTRWTAAQELELATVPCIVAQLSDADADIMMAETNIQRPDWLPSERAKTYKVWLEAVQTETGITQGQRTDTTSGTECPKLGRNRDVAAQRFGIGPKTLDMYIKLNDLVPDLQKMMDAGQIKFTPAVELAYIKPKNQRYIAVAIEGQQSAPSLSQAQRMRELDQKGVLNGDVIDGIMMEDKKEVDKVILTGAELGKYFGKETTPREMKDQIIKLLDDWKGQQKEVAKPEKKAAQQEK